MACPGPGNGKTEHQNTSCSGPRASEPSKPLGPSRFELCCEITASVTSDKLPASRRLEAQAGPQVDKSHLHLCRWFPPEQRAADGSCLVWPVTIQGTNIHGQTHRHFKGSLPPRRWHPPKPHWLPPARPSQLSASAPAEEPSTRAVTRETDLPLRSPTRP